MAAGMAIAILATTALQMYGKYKSSKSQSDLLHSKEEQLRQQGEEIMARMKVTNKLLQEDAKSFMGTQRTTAASSGTDVGSGSNILALEDTATRLARQMVLNRNEAMYENDLLQMEAKSYGQQAYLGKKAAAFSMLTTGAGGAISAYDAWDPERSKKKGS